MKTSTITLRPAVVSDTTSICIYVEPARALELRDFDKFATFVIRTGAASVQTYLKPDDCRKLASNLLDAAVDLQKQINALEAA